MKRPVSWRSPAHWRKSRAQGALGEPFGQPVVDVALSAVGQVALAGGQEGQEGDSGVQADLGVPGGGASRPGGFGPLAGPAQDAPTRIRAQQPALARVSDAGEMVSGPSLEAHESVIASGEHAVGDEQVAQVVGALAGALRVQGLVGKGDLAGGDFAQEPGGGRTAQPVVGAIRLGCCHDGLVDGPQRPVGAADEIGRTAGERAPYATAVQIWPFFGATGPASGQWGDAGAVGAPASARAGGRHQAALGPARLTGPSPGQGSPVARFAYGPFGPARTGRAVLAAVGAAAQRFGRAGHADGPARDDEIAGTLPPAHRAAGQRAVEAAGADVAFSAMGTPCDRP